MSDNLHGQHVVDIVELAIRHSSSVQDQMSLLCYAYGFVAQGAGVSVRQAQHNVALAMEEARKMGASGLMTTEEVKPS